MPLTAPELADCAESLVDCGVSVLHLHVRDNSGRHTLDAQRYREALASIRERVGDRLILQVTTEAVGLYNRQQQMALVRELRTEAVSLALRELCPDPESVAEASRFFHAIRRAGCWPQYILYSPAEVALFEAMRKDGVFGEDRPFALFVLGRYSDSLTGEPAELDGFLEACQPVEFPWAVCCFGPHEAAAISRAATLGGMPVSVLKTTVFCRMAKSRQIMPNWSARRLPPMPLRMPRRVNWRPRTGCGNTWPVQPAANPGRIRRER